MKYKSSIACIYRFFRLLYKEYTTYLIIFIYFVAFNPFEGNHLEISLVT